MATYAIGDIQGCFAALNQLLAQIEFNKTNDTLWFTGDLVNRGSQSLAVLRYIKSLGDKHIVILGNHDIHLLALYFTQQKQNKNDTLQAILDADDVKDLIDWLRYQPLMHVDTKLNYVMVHAGFAPMWSIATAQQLAHEVELLLQQQPEKLLQHIYGDLPDYWEEDLTGIDRLRCIVNYLTRVRLCDKQGKMDFKFRGQIQDKPNDLLPWFELPNRKIKDTPIIFGHWAALLGEASEPNVFPIDTGCVWGGHLTAIRLEDKQKFQVKCYKP